MDNMKRIFLIFIFFSFFVTPGFCLPSEALAKDGAQENIFYMSELKEKQGIVSLKKNADKIDVVAPQVYGISSKLKLGGGLSANLKKAILQAKTKNKNIKVMPLVANYAFRQDIMHNLLVSPKAQDEVIKSLVAEAKKEKYIGWQFDFENISYLDKDLYSAFVEKTAKSLHENNLILSVAAVSRSVDYENTDGYKNWSGAFDYERLAKAVDFISLMTYDDFNSVGPVASLPFVNDVLNYVKGKIPPEKLSFGIPLYNWGWRVNPFKKISASGTYDGLLYIKKNFESKTGWDEALGAAWLSYFWQNKQYQIWYQDKKTFESKLEIISQNNFRGFSAWVLGVEDPQIWDTLYVEK